MVRILIKMDEEKIKREGIYNYDRLLQWIDEFMCSNGISKAKDGWYEGSWEACGARLYDLKEIEGIKDNAQQMIWRNMDYETSGELYLEDWLHEDHVLIAKEYAPLIEMDYADVYTILSDALMNNENGAQIVKIYGRDGFVVRGKVTGVKAQTDNCWIGDNLSVCIDMNDIIYVEIVN